MLHGRPSNLSLTKSMMVPALFVLVVAVGFSVGAYWLHRLVFEAGELDAARQELEEIVSVKTGLLEAAHEELRKDAESVQGNPFLMEAMRAVLSGMADGETIGRLTAWMERELGLYPMDHIGLIGRDGELRMMRNIEGAGGFPDFLTHAPEHLEEALSSGEVVMTPFHASPDGQRVHMTILIPVPAGEDMAGTAGVLAAIFYPDEERLLRRGDDHYRWESFGSVLGIIEGEGIQPVGRSEGALSDPLSAGTTGPDSPFTLSELGGHEKRRLVKTRYFPEMGLILLCHVDREEVLKLLRRDGRALAYAGGMTVFGLSFVGLLLLRFYQGRSLQRELLLTRERQAVQEEAARLEQWFQKAVSESPFPIMIHADDGEVLHLSRSWCTLSGYDRESIQTVQDWHRLVLEKPGKPDGPDRSLAPVLDPGLITLKRPDGELLTWELTRESLGRLPNGRELIMTMALDRTEQLASEKELRLVHNALDYSANGVVITDREGTIVYANRALEGLSGYRREDLIGKPATLFDSDEHPDEFFERQQADLMAGKVWEGKMYCRHRSGSVQYEHVTMNPIRDEAGHITHIISVRVDMREQQKLEQQLYDTLNKAVEASRMKSVFLATIGHEIRTPLNGIMGMTQLLGETSLDEEQRGMCRIASSCCQTLVGVIDDVLDFSRIESGKYSIEKANFNLCEAMAETVFLVRKRAEAKGLSVQFDWDPTLPGSFYGDRSRIAQVLTNLLNNAIKFSDSGTIELRGQRVESERQDRVRLSVKDEGIGIREADRERIFECFSQVDQSHTRSHGGLGLGLSISRRLVELMGGRIGFESVPDKGSTFWIELELDPAGEPLPVEESPRPRNGSEVPSRPALKVLVVDDDDSNVFVLQRLLKSLGQESVAASDGEEALARLSAEPFDLVLLDCQMPRMDGYEVTRRVRSEAVENVPVDIPIIALTGSVMQNNRELCQRIGMNGFLEKPVTRARLQETIRDFAGEPVA